MSQFDEFERPVTTIQAPSQVQGDIAEEFPACAALVAELRSCCPGLLGSAQVIYAKELSTGKELKKRVYRLSERMASASVDEYIALGQVAKRNGEFVNRSKRGKA